MLVPYMSVKPVQRTWHSNGFCILHTFSISDFACFICMMPLNNTTAVVVFPEGCCYGSFVIYFVAFPFFAVLLPVLPFAFICCRNKCDVPELITMQISHRTVRNDFSVSFVTVRNSVGQSSFRC